MTATDVADERFLSFKDVIHLTTLSRTQIYHLVETGRFPRAIRITPHRLAWRDSEVRCWMAEKIAASDAA